MGERVSGGCHWLRAEYINSLDAGWKAIEGAVVDMVNTVLCEVHSRWFHRWCQCIGCALLPPILACRTFLTRSCRVFGTPGLNPRQPTRPNHLAWPACAPPAGRYESL